MKTKVIRRDYQKVNKRKTFGAQDIQVHLTSLFLETQKRLCKCSVFAILYLKYFTLSITIKFLMIIDDVETSEKQHQNSLQDSIVLIFFGEFKPRSTIFKILKSPQSGEKKQTCHRSLH